VFILYHKLTVYVNVNFPYGCVSFFASSTDGGHGRGKPTWQGMVGMAGNGGHGREWWAWQGMVGMAGASPATTIDGQRPSQRHIVVASLAGAMLAGAMQKMHHTLSLPTGRTK